MPTTEYMMCVSLKNKIIAFTIILLEGLHTHKKKNSADCEVAQLLLPPPST
jgi:hypothetical protein